MRKKSFCVVLDDDIKDALDGVVRAGMFGYRSKGDVIRDALDRHLEFLHMLLEEGSEHEAE